MVDRVREEEFRAREEETAPYKTEARGEKEICIAGPRDGVNRERGGEREGLGQLSQYIGGGGFCWKRPKGLSNDTYHTWNHTPADTYVRYRAVFLRRSFSLRFHQLDRAKKRLSVRVDRTPSPRVEPARPNKSLFPTRIDIRVQILFFFFLSSALLIALFYSSLILRIHADKR